VRLVVSLCEVPEAMSQDDAANEPLDPEEEARIRLAFSRTNLPGWILIATGALNLIIGSLIISRGFEFLEMAPADIIKEIDKATNGDFKPNLDPEDVKIYFVAAAFVWGTLAALASLVTITGGMRMRALQSYRVAMTGAVLAAVPFVSLLACMGLGLAAGIWAVMILIQPDVKSAFV